MDLIISHKSCPDGWAAAFIARKRYSEAEILLRDHGLPPPYAEVENQDVIVTDFSWRTREENIRLSKLAKSFHIYDHHKTAQAELEGLDFVTFDLNRSGAGLAWDYLFGKDVDLSPPADWLDFYPNRPWWVDYVEDRDLWRHALPQTKEVNAYLMTLPHTISAWETLDNVTVEQAAGLGKGALAQVEHYVEKAIEHRQIGLLDDKTVAVVNAQYMNISEVGHALTYFADIGLGWFERGDGIVQFSLRSVGDTDVSKIAKSFGGGGHLNAAGFQLSLAEGRNLVDRILSR